MTIQKKPTTQATPNRYTKNSKSPIQDEKADKLTDGLGAQGMVQDSTRGLSTATKIKSGAQAPKMVDKAAKIAAGETDEIARGIRGLTIALSHHTPKFLRPLVAAGVPLSKVTAPALGFIGKAGPIISVPFAFYDVAKAVTEPDPKERPAQWTNATLTVAGTAIGVAGVMVASPALATGLLVGSTAIAGFQLFDAYTKDGAMTKSIGNFFAGRQ
jgi:hypothetical protein